VGPKDPLFCCLKMMYENQIENIRCNILPELEKAGIELVDIELKGRIGRQVLRIFVDTTEGISLDQCAQLSSKISDILDIKDIIPGKYTLEVSSPGLDRPLRRISDFRRHVGENVRIVYQDQGNTLSIEGLLKGVSKDGVVRINANFKEYEIQLIDIRKAKLILPW